MSNYAESLEWLFSLTTRGMKFGLENVTELLHRIGDPHKAFRMVHVGGTNGKGSVSAMMESVLRKAGHRTGLYTSPHLIDFVERIRVDGGPISEEEVVSYANTIRPIVDAMDIEGKRLTFFEITTAMAFLHFREKGVQVAVVEVGLGGRLDATNVIRPECSIITKLGIEHTSFLGDTLAEIAWEKAGIVKEGVPVITSEIRPEALEVISRRCDELQAPLKVIDPDEVRIVRHDVEGIDVFIKGKRFHLPLLGRYQASNALLAYEGLRCIQDRGIELNDRDIFEGLGDVRWQARMELVRRSPNIVFDVTHTAEGAREVASNVRELFPGRKLLVIGILADKDVDGLCRELGGMADMAISVRPETDRAFDHEELAKVLGRYCDEVIAIGPVHRAMEAAVHITDENDTIIVSGSLYTAGEAMRWLGIRVN